MIVQSASERVYRGTYNWWRRFSDKRAGVWDGLFSIPAEDENLTNITFFRRIVDGETRAFARLLKLCEAGLQRARRRLQRLRADSYSATNSGQALQELEQYCERRGIDIPTETTLNRLYFPIMALLALVEAPVNALAMQIFFGGSLALTGPPGLLVGIILMCLAHWLGGLLKDIRSNQSQEKQNGAETVVGIGIQSIRLFGAAAIAISTIFIIYLLGKVRQFYVDFMTQTSADSNLAQLLERGFETTIAASLDAPLKSDGLLLIMLNGFVVLIGTVFAYQHRIGDPVLRRLFRKAAREREIKLLRTSIDDAYNDILQMRMNRANFTLLRLSVYRDANSSVRWKSSRVASMHNVNVQLVAEEICRESIISEKFS